MMEIANRYYLSTEGKPPFAGTITYLVDNGGAKRTVAFSLPEDESYYEVTEAEYRAEVARLEQVEKDKLEAALQAQKDALAATYNQRKTDYELLVGMGMSPSTASKLANYTPE